MKKKSKTSRFKMYLYYGQFYIMVLIGIFSAHKAYTENKESSIYGFTRADVAFLQAFSLSSLPKLPVSVSNKYADNIAAAKLGRKIFYDRRLSKNKKISCSSCHQPEKYFTDGLSQAKALGVGKRSTPTLLGAVWSPWQYWDGRKDSLWSQALEPIEHRDEMGTDRATFVRKLLKYYRDDYQEIFGKISNLKKLQRSAKNASPSKHISHVKLEKRWQALDEGMRTQINRIFTNAGKSLMAYQRQLILPLSRFDKFVDALSDYSSSGHLPGREAEIPYLSPQEISGMRLFMGKGNCASCHNGPFFTNYEFHNIGAPEFNEKQVDLGRYSGVQSLMHDEFSCLSVWSDAQQSQCQEMMFLKRSGPELVGAFKTPTLRNISQTAPYMQSGQFLDLTQVLNHYNVPVPPFYDRGQHPNRPHFDILPLKLEQDEIENILFFLDALTSVYPSDDFWWNINLKDNTSSIQGSHVKRS